MQKLTYKEMLQHPEWQKKRLEVLSAHKFACEQCHGADTQLHVHHGYYDNSIKLWEYDLEHLHCLCSVCHDEAHKLTINLMKQVSADDIFKTSIGIGACLSFFTELGLNLQVASADHAQYPEINATLLEKYRIFKEQYGSEDG